MEQPQSPPQGQATNPLLERSRIPGETFAMPSHGLFYNSGELTPEVVNGEVVVHPMVTMDELAMKSPDKLLNGTSVVEVFKRCIPQILKPEGLLAKDVDYLMICLRKVTYGDNVEISHTHSCEGAKRHSYQVPLDIFLKSTKNLEPEIINTKYSITLPNGQVVKMLPPKYVAVLKFYQAINDDGVSEQQVTAGVLNSILNLIVSVDGYEERAFISEWLNTLSAGFVKKITGNISVISEWGATVEATVKCKDCNEDVKLSPSLNPIDFFS